MTWCCVLRLVVRVCSQKQTQNTQKLKTLNIFLTGFKNHLFFSPKRALLFSPHIAKEHHSRCLSTSIRKEETVFIDEESEEDFFTTQSRFWNNGRVFYFSFKFFFSRGAEDDAKNHRSGDDVVHGVGETQVRGSSSSKSSSSSSLKRNAKEHHVPLARTKGENDFAASLGGKYERIQSKLGDVLVPPKAPATRVAGEGKLGTTTIKSLSRDGDERERETIERRTRR